MLSPFLLLSEWTAATGNPSMPGLAALDALESPADLDLEGWPDEGQAHPAPCECPDCAGDKSPMLDLTK